MKLWAVLFPTQILLRMSPISPAVPHHLLTMQLEWNLIMTPGLTI